MVLHFTYLSALFLSSLVGFTYREDLKSRLLSFFPFYLFLVFCQELFLFLYVSQHPTYSTGFIYNIYCPVNALFVALFYYHIPFNAPSRKLMAGLIVLYLATLAVTFGFIQSIRIYNNYLFLAGGFLITVCAILFLFNYFKLDNRAEEKKWLPAIWITIGVVVFYPVISISFALYKYLLIYQATIFGIKIYQLIPQLMSIFMYGCFIRAFYLCRKKK